MMIQRRRFLGSSAAGFFAWAWRFGCPRLVQAAISRSPGLRRCIVLWMDGGPSQMETFDPKPGTETGGPVQSIATSVPGLHISEFLPQIARRMHHLSVIRNLTSTEGEHQRAQHLMHTGYPRIDSFPRPSLGSIVSYETPPSAIPRYVTLGSRGFGPAFLGPEHGPFSIGDPDEARDMLSVLRQRRERLQFLQELSRPFATRHPDAAVQRRRAMIGQIEQLVDTPFSRALDLQREPASSRQRYGDSEFGRFCLLARRLLEADVRFVEIQLGGWDTHSGNFSATRRLCETIDLPWAALLDDLDERGLLDDTVLLWMGEFGRTPVINAAAGRDHFPAVTPAVIGGGGVRGGQVVGATTRDGRAIDGDSLTVPDLFATVLQRLDIEPDTEFTTSFGSPAPATDGGTPIAALL